MRRPGALRLVVLAVALCGLVLLAPAPARSQDEPDLQAQAEALLQAMTVPERIGQLFLVTFRGDRAPAQSAIGDLILNYHVGGVALLAENDNLTGYGDPAQTPVQALELSTNLQRMALLGFSEEPNPEDDGVAPPTAEPQPRANPIPLLIATVHDGDSLPVQNVLAGFTAVPNYMALGATWEPDYARRVGEIVGRELAATGVNLLLGPPLDVLERPSPRSAGDLGTHVFGGDPYWVSLMGSAYIEGVHGGGDRLAVVARSFPGKGSSDRPVDVEVPTVRRSLEQLKQIELAPFFAVTRQTPGAPATADALLATHIRYQGFQGNIRATTAPVSLDPQALNSLMALPEFAPWRQAGGVIVSDQLGARSVQRFYDDTEREFPHRQVARDALLAGNDLLFVADFALDSDNEADQLANVKDTIAWFGDRYETDPPFRQRVDDAVRRILQLKLRLYGSDFTAANVIGEPLAEAPFPATGDAAFFDIAEAAITLLAPSPDELNASLVTPPTLGDRLVIFTDVQTVRPCSACEPQPVLSPAALQERILAIYGPDGSGQVQPDNISSFSFADLNDYLDAGAEPIPLPTTPISPTLSAEDATSEADGTPAPTATLPADYRVQEALREADWLVFALLNAGENGGAESQALSRFLAQRPDLASQSEVVVMAFDAPYFLDSTEISKLSAYYGIYSRTGAFVDAAARALFLESPLLGAPPVSVEGIQFDLFTQTQPTPDQIIELFLVIGQEIEAPSRQEPLASAIGDTLRLQTGVIVDRNRRPVPDGTLVRFILRNRVQGTVTILGDRPTTGGIAQLDYVLDASMGPGQFRITAESGEATVSQEVDIVIEAEEDAQLAIIAPTPAPTMTPTTEPTATATPEPTATPPPQLPTATPPLPAPAEELGWLIALSEMRSLLGVLTGLLAVGVAAVMLDRLGVASLPQRVGRLLWGLVGGLLLYNYYALEMPGAGLLSGLGSAAGLVLVVLGGAAGLLLHRALHPGVVVSD